MLVLSRLARGVSLAVTCFTFFTDCSKQIAPLLIYARNTNTTNFKMNNLAAQQKCVFLRTRFHYPRFSPHGHAPQAVSLLGICLDLCESTLTGMQIYCLRPVRLVGLSLGKKVDPANYTDTKNVPTIDYDVTQVKLIHF